MAARCANRDLVSYANHGVAAKGYGNMSVSEYPLGAGYLPKRVGNIFFSRSSRALEGAWIKTVVYSYGTPIAWFDSEFGVWVQPDTRYSVTTTKHQGYLWRLTGDVVYIPADCGRDEYRRYASGQMVYTATGTKPGPTWTLD